MKQMTTDRRTESVTNDRGPQRLNDEAEAIRAQIQSFRVELEQAGLVLPQSAVERFHNINARLHILEEMLESTEEEWRGLQALAEIGYVINSSLDLKTVLNKVMDTIILLTGAERVFLMLRKGDDEMDIVVARNWEHESIDPVEHEISQTIVYEVVQSEEPVLTTNAQEDPRFGALSSVVTYSLRSVLCVPLKAKDSLIGVIYADNKAKEGTFEEKDCDLLSAFANQAAVALENAQLFEGLSKAYHETIDALIAALDARDHETEGHTQRVVLYSLTLAEKMGLSKEARLDLRRGALMHDIGKLGVPDAILLKPGPLSPEEQALMQRHAEHGLRMLEGIDFLQEAANIIGSHHEHFDGTGYPRGLKGDEIPLGARIFMVADTFDAITSDRRYRTARTYEEARQEIMRESGRQFDPEVVEIFLAIPEREWMRLRSVTVKNSGHDENTGISDQGSGIQTISKARSLAPNP